MRQNLTRVGLIALVSMAAPASAIAAGNDSTLPRQVAAHGRTYDPANRMEPKNVPDFARDSQSGSSPKIGTALQAGVESTTLPVETRLKLVLEYALDAKTNQPGDIFEAHVKDDLYLGTSLLLPRGSLVRGRVMAVSKPRWVSRAARIGLRLEQIVTPTGEVIPLDAALEFQKGLTNQHGEFDPGTNFGSRVGSDLKTVTGLNSTGTTRGALLAANVATLGAPAVATMIGGSAVALFRSGDNVSLMPGQEIEVLLTNDLGLQIN